MSYLNAEKDKPVQLIHFVSNNCELSAVAMNDFWILQFSFYTILCYQDTEYFKILGNRYFHNCPEFASYLMACPLKHLECSFIFLKSRMNKEKSYTSLPQVSVLARYRLWYADLYVSTLFSFLNLKVVVHICAFVAFWGIHICCFPWQWRYRCCYHHGNGAPEWSCYLQRGCWKKEK